MRCLEQKSLPPLKLQDHPLGNYASAKLRFRFRFPLSIPHANGLHIITHTANYLYMSAFTPVETTHC